MFGGFTASEQPSLGSLPLTCEVRVAPFADAAVAHRLVTTLCTGTRTTS
ncbi:MAG: hypothetical protein QOG17_74 [Gammaproteobacteria bacterium]|nr:hypothetical protein [Gammaproteobacteria bacterium]